MLSAHWVGLLYNKSYFANFMILIFPTFKIYNFFFKVLKKFRSKKKIFNHFIIC